MNKCIDVYVHALSLCIHLGVWHVTTVRYLIAFFWLLAELVAANAVEAPANASEPRAFIADSCIF